MRTISTSSEDSVHATNGSALTDANPFPVPVAWLRALAGAATLISAAGLLALLAYSARAEDPKGFEPGQRAFTNPFANINPGTPPPPGKNTNFFDDEDDEDLPEDRPPGNPPPPPQGFTPPGGKPGFGSTPPPQGGLGKVGGDSGGVSLGGTPSGGVVSHNKVKPITIDTETGIGEGSKEIVTDFNFPDADIMDIAKALGKLTGKNFILDKDVKGRITIISNSPITIADAWRSFLTALDMAGYALIPGGSHIRISRQRDARDKHPKIYLGDYSPDSDALITRIFGIKYISAEEVARVFRSILPPNARIIPYEQTNTLIVTDTGSTISKISKLLEILDVEGYDAGIEVISVRYASAAELAKLIDTLIPGTSTGPGGGPRVGTIGGGGRFTARRTKEGGIINTIISDERTNTLIVHANGKGAEQVRALVSKLDQRLPAQTGGGKVHVVYLQFAEAEQMANTLNNLSSGGGRSGAPGPGGGTGINPVATSLFEGQIKVSPDKATNALVVTASPSDFVTVQRVINKLDIPRDQVYVEAVIMELSLNRDFQFSTNVVNPSSGIGFLPSGQDLAAAIASPIGQKGLILGFQAGGKTEIEVGGKKFTVGNVQGLIKALQTHNQANVLATPQIMTLDNTEAIFETTEKIPVPTTTAVQGAISTSITKEPVALKIKLKPQINKISNFVKLHVETQLTDITNRELPAQVADLARATLERNVNTDIVVADNDTVVLGGLVRDDHGETVSKVPILGDIPLLGWLFKSKSSGTKKTNLLVFITPHIVRQYEAVRAVLDRKLKERDDFIEQSAGGEDYLRKYRDNMIRGLPDMKDIQAHAPQRAITIDEDNPAPAENEPKSTDGKPAAPPKTPGAGTLPAPGADTGQAPPAAPPAQDSLPPATAPGDQ